MRMRTRARELALQYLYMAEVSGDCDVETPRHFFHAESHHHAAIPYAEKLVALVRENRAEIDAQITAVAENFSLERMAAIDRNILRLATAEILQVEDVPDKVALNEAIELARKYSTEKSGAFVNGVLDRICQRRRVPPGGQP